MDKYDVIGLLGEGSFGRVYKAKRNSDGEFVALKVISKRGRLTKELKGLRRECEIQRHLHHPNIIQMLDSFETENEIVVVTEFAQKELNLILGKEGHLPEHRVQKIVWDLLSALYYLHSHRVLHRDIKPQNILIDVNDVAKLCDFGFARNMSTGTHVLTSIKGTPLYMAPELMEEQPYDHNADLWSLGCIIYELLVGAPPFCTTSILHLIRLVKYEQIQWPSFISEDGISFLKGLLQKKPSNRLTWPEILKHPFVKGHILITEDTPVMPLTRPMSANTLQVKEKQRIERYMQKTQSKQINMQVLEKNSSVGGTPLKDSNNKSLDKMPVDECKRQSIKDSKSNSKEFKEGKSAKWSTNQEKIDDLCSKFSAMTDSKTSSSSWEIQEQLDLTRFDNDHSKPIENDEWIAFLQKTIIDILNDDLTALTQINMANILASPLRNSNSNSRVINLVAKVFCLPFAISQTSKNLLEKTFKVYINVKLIPNLVYSSKLLMIDHNVHSQESTSPTGTPFTHNYIIKSFNDLACEDLEALENIYCLICFLTHSDNEFILQFCDSVVIFGMYNIVYQLLSLFDKKIRIVNDLIAILTNVLNVVPENFELVQRIFRKDLNRQEGVLDISRMLKNSNPLLKERICRFLALLAKYDKDTLVIMWNEDVKDIIETLVYDSLENVRNAAELCVDAVKNLDFDV